MKLSIVDNQRREAQPGLSGECPVCKATTIAKCGEKNVWHWAHKGRRNCDRWWEPETEWHRSWKNHFPVEWQEIIHWAEDGEKHIADVKTSQDWVIEFQHSHIQPEERRSREDFYEKMVWVVDGLRRKNDLKQFVEAVNYGQRISQKPLMLSLSGDSCRLMRDWSSNSVPTFFDFGDDIRPNGLWMLTPMVSYHNAYAFLIDKASFVDGLKNSTFNPQPFFDLTKDYEKERRRKNRLHYTFNRRPRRSRSRF
tara:strand:- start:2192 stop:2947 length:756 start_codon:yes stop_codon:yes gene_type:complete